MTTETLTISDWIQLIIAVSTLFAVIIALSSGMGFWQWLKRPKIKISFDRESDRCFRWAIRSTDNIQDEGQREDIKRYYFRLKVSNSGGLAKNLKVRVEIYNKEWKKVERFEPSTLRWVGGQESNDLTRGESEYINFLSQVADPGRLTNNLRIEIYNFESRGIAWDRPLACYNYQIIIYGENINPKVYIAQFIPDESEGSPGSILIKENE